MNIEIIQHNSKTYWQSVKLRDKILRKPLGLEFTKEELLKEDKQIHFVGFLSGKIVAILILVPKEKFVIKMRQVCVDENFQNKGLGKEMVQFAEKWAKTKNYKLIYCHARKNALNFYLKLNYKIKGEMFFEVNLEHYKLERKLY